jgi:hypothetical protein
MKPVPFFFLVLAGSVVPGSAPHTIQTKSSPASVAIPLSMPPGWLVYSRQRPDDKALACANYSNHEWSLSSQAGRIKIQNAREPIGEMLNPVPLPFPIPQMNPEQRKAFSADDRSPYDQTGELRDLWEMHGYRTQMKADIGWMVGFNAGEFGGWLYWFDDKGKTFQHIKNVQNVIGFMKGPMGLYSLSGLAHMGLNYGHIHRLERDPTGAWTAKEIVQLGSSPYTFTQESGTTWLILTHDALFRFFDSGRMEKIAKVNYSLLYPHSMLLDPAGDIYIGMRLFVTHLKKTEKGYDEEWLVPAGCESFTRNEKEFKCTCTGSQLCSPDNSQY